MSIVTPALRGDDPLGFLAAIGVMALAEQDEIPPLRLAWEGRSAPVATFEGVASLGELGTALTAALERVTERGELLPGMGADFPMPNTGSTTDRMRMTRDEMATWFEKANRQWLDNGDPWFGRWLHALAGQSAVKDEQRGDIELTPFYAPTGRMTLRGSLLEATTSATQAISGPRDALVSWQRAAFDGANFDDRAKRDAAVTTHGEPDNRAAPSPTWLAVMGMRCFTMTDDGRATATVGWQRVRLYPGFTRRSLVWPVWSMPLDPPAVRTLLAHPALELDASRGPDDPRISRASQRSLPLLGVTAVFGSSRRTLQQGDGPLGPARRLWPAVAN